MSVVGFDVGNESGIVAVARKRGIEVVLNDESKRETPAIVCFGEKQRFIGTAGAASSMMNPKNSITQIKRLVGRKFSDPELQRDIQNLPFAVTEGPDGFPLIQARYLGEQRTFTPTQVLGMVLSNLKGIAEKSLNADVVDCCIGIPVYFTDLQRRAVLDAATIAGLHPLRLFHETTATALAYGIYKTDLPENDQVNVAFVDIGHASMQVCIAGFKKGQLKVLAHSFDRSLGGRDFDEVLFKHFAAKFKKEYKIDVYQNARACIRLRAACEKLKKVLSAYRESPLNIDCLMDEKDVRGFIKREEFEKISKPILERVKGPLENALVDAGLTVENIHSVEVVGSGSRVPAIIKILTEFFGKEPRRTMNASECVARGCALQCAILSPTFKARKFQVHESFSFSIALSWKGSAQDSQSETEHQQSAVVFPKGNPIPSVKALSFFRSGTFSLDVMYADASELQLPSPKISTYTIGPFQSAKGERAKMKVKVRLNLHGIVSVESATMLEEEGVKVPVPAEREAPKEAVKMDTDEAKADSSAGNDVNMQDASGAGVENGVPAPEFEEKPFQMETDAKEVIQGDRHQPPFTVWEEELAFLDFETTCGLVENSILPRGREVLQGMDCEKLANFVVGCGYQLSMFGMELRCRAVEMIGVEAQLNFERQRADVAEKRASELEARNEKLDEDLDKALDAKSKAEWELSNARYYIVSLSSARKAAEARLEKEKSELQTRVAELERSAVSVEALRTDLVAKLQHSLKEFLELGSDGSS